LALLTFTTTIGIGDVDNNNNKTTLTLPKFGTHNFCPTIRSSSLLFLPPLPFPSSYAYAIYACRPRGPSQARLGSQPGQLNIQTHTHTHMLELGRGSVKGRGRDRNGGTHIRPKVSRCPDTLHAYFARILEFQLKINHKNVAAPKLPPFLLSLPPENAV